MCDWSIKKKKEKGGENNFKKKGEGIIISETWECNFPNGEIN